MKKSIIKFVIKTWLTLPGVIIFCIVWWIPTWVASILSGDVPDIFEHYLLLFETIKWSLYAIYSLVSWLGLRWILQDYMKNHECNHPFFEFRLSKNGTYEDRVQDLKEEILGAILSFILWVFLIILFVLQLCNAV